MDFLNRNWASANGYNTVPPRPARTRRWQPERLAARRKPGRKVKKTEQQQEKNRGSATPSCGFWRQEKRMTSSISGMNRKMSKESIQEVVQKSLEEYFNDLGEQQASNIYDMVVLTVEKPILEVVMTRADGNQSHAAQMLGINRNTLRKKLQEHGLL
jgi:Fis family transcriptional regulator